MRATQFSVQKTIDTKRTRSDASYKKRLHTQGVNKEKTPVTRSSELVDPKRNATQRCWIYQSATTMGQLTGSLLPLLGRKPWLLQRIIEWKEQQRALLPSYIADSQL